MARPKRLGSPVPRDVVFMLLPETRNEESEARLRAMVLEHFDFVWRCLRRLGLSQADADETAQEVFVMAERKLSVIQRGKERAFLFSAAVHFTATRRRSLARERRALAALAGEPTEAVPTPEQLTRERRAVDELDAVLSEMNVECREVFILFELEGQTLASISTMLDVPPGTVASRLRKARQDFVDSLKRRAARDRWREAR